MVKFPLYKAKILRCSPSKFSQLSIHVEQDQASKYASHSHSSAFSHEHAYT